MATFAQGAPIERIPARYLVDPQSVFDPALDGPPEIRIFPASDRGESAGTFTDTPPASPIRNTFKAYEALQASGGFDWFEDFHVIPRSFDFGNLLSDQSVPIEVFSAFRKEVREWASFVNNAGVGVDLVGEPTLASDVDPLSGFQMTLDVTRTGPAFVDATLDFAFTGVGTIYVPIMVQRIVLFGKIPELPYSERFSFLTKVMTKVDGSEQRRRLRKNPRHSFDYSYIIDEGVESATFENLLFDFQSLTFGVPHFDHDSLLTVAASAGATTITVDSTTYRDFREGGLAVIMTSQSDFDVLEIDAGGITPTTLSFTSPLVGSYAIGVTVFPLNPSRAQRVIDGARWTTGARRMGVNFKVVDNDVDLADLSPFSSYKSKLLLDSGNTMLSATKAHSYEQALVLLDNQIGLVEQSSFWDHHKRKTNIVIRADGRQAKWELRGLIAALEGRGVSFYMPTDGRDLNVVADLLSAGMTMDVTNVGYNQFVRERLGKSDLRVNFVDGSTPLLREITGSEVVSSTVERLTLDLTWPTTITPAEISHVDFVEKVRLDSDDVIVRHADGSRAYMVSPIRTLFE